MDSRTWRRWCASCGLSDRFRFKASHRLIHGGFLQGVFFYNARTPVVIQLQCRGNEIHTRETVAPSVATVNRSPWRCIENILSLFFFLIKLNRVIRVSIKWSDIDTYENRTTHVLYHLTPDKQFATVAWIYWAGFFSISY